MLEKDTIIHSLELNPSLILDLAAEFEVSCRSARLWPKKWSALEHIAHLARVEPMLRARLQCMLAEPDAPIVPYDPDRDSPGTLKEADWDESLGIYQRGRAEFMGILRGVDPPSWERLHVHPECNRYSIRHLARHLALHDLLHGYRIEELLLGLPAT
jgi:hypothetical protein